MIKVTVKCVGCGAKKEIGPGEVGANDVPMCDKCLMPMVAMSAKEHTLIHER